MKKAMISQPMGGLTEDELLEIRDKAKAELEELGYEVLNTVFASFDNDAGLMDPDHIALLHLGKSLEEMAKCDLVYFCETGRTNVAAALNIRRQVLTESKPCTKRHDKTPGLRLGAFFDVLLPAKIGALFGALFGKTFGNDGE